jgi:chromate transporter
MKFIGGSMEKDRKFYLKLFLSTFYLSAFTFGGGYVIVPLMRKKFVNEYKWIGEEEMIDLIAIAQSSPGAIAINSSIIIGYKLAGVIGALCTLIGTILPPLIIISIVSLFYIAFRDNAIVNGAMKGMQAGVAAIIADVVFKLVGDIRKLKNSISVYIMLGAFIATFFMNIIFIIFICGFIGVIYKNYMRKRGN